MNVLNPYVRQFLVGWITVLDSVPDIDMLGFLPDFLDGNPYLFSKCITFILLLTAQQPFYHYPCRFIQYAEWFQSWDKAASWCSTFWVSAGDKELTSKAALYGYQSFNSLDVKDIVGCLFLQLSFYFLYKLLKVVFIFYAFNADYHNLNEKNVDYGRMAEILVRRAGSTDEFTRLTSITWVICLSCFLCDLKT